MSIRKQITLRRWLYEHSPMAEGLLRQYDEQCEALKSSNQPVDLTRLIGEVRRRFTALRLEVDSSIVDDIENSFNDLLVPIIQPPKREIIDDEKSD